MSKLLIRENRPEIKDLTVGKLEDGSDELIQCLHDTITYLSGLLAALEPDSKDWLVVVADLTELVGIVDAATSRDVSKARIKLQTTYGCFAGDYIDYNNDHIIDKEV